MNDRIDAQRPLSIFMHELVGHDAGKAAAPAVGVESQEVIAIGMGFTDPQLADQAVGRQQVGHERRPRC